MIDKLIEDMKFSSVDTPKLDAARLAELIGVNLPAATPESIGIKITALQDDPTAAEDAEKVLRSVVNYLAVFMPPGGCPNCGRKHGFTWGMAHGEGHCVNCMYPGRAVHDIPDVGVIRNLVLWYHPSDLKMP